jgi:hypothetical protein
MNNLTPLAYSDPGIRFPIGSMQEYAVSSEPAVKYRYSGPPGNYPYGANRVPNSTTTMVDQSSNRQSSGFDDKTPLTEEERTHLEKQYNDLQQQSQIQTPIPSVPKTPLPLATLAAGAGALALGALAASASGGGMPTDRDVLGPPISIPTNKTTNNITPKIDLPPTPVLRPIDSVGSIYGGIYPFNHRRRVRRLVDI